MNEDLCLLKCHNGMSVRDGKLKTRCMLREPTEYFQRQELDLAHYINLFQRFFKGFFHAGLQLFS